MLLALVRLESPTGSVFENGMENLNGGFVLQISAILAVLKSKSLRTESRVSGRLWCCCLILHNPEVAGLCFAQWVTSVPVET